MNALKPKHQRLVLVVLALVALVGAGLLAAYALRNQASYFYLPEQMRDDPPEIGQAVRLGGMVQEGSLRTMADGVTVAFTVTGREASAIPVRFTGILPDLFAENQGMIGTGRFIDGTFVADEILAKHDESYMPKEVVEALKEQGEWKPEATN